jgi:hypothetical protein
LETSFNQLTVDARLRCPLIHDPPKANIVPSLSPYLSLYTRTGTRYHLKP